MKLYLMQIPLCHVCMHIIARNLHTMKISRNLLNCYNIRNHWVRNSREGLLKYHRKRKCNFL